MIKRTCTIVAAGAALLLPLLSASPALAHEGRDLGDLDMEVGWGTEPALAGQMNSALLLLTHDGQPVVDLGDTLRFEVTFGDQTQTFPIEPFFDEDEGFGTPGDYRAWFIPTRPGDYTFHYVGKIDGEAVDETFKPGPGSAFEEVDSPQSIQFPEQDPSTGELAARIDREIPRINDQIDAAAASAGSVSDDASSAKTIAIVGIVVGALGLTVAIIALVTARRRRA